MATKEYPTRSIESPDHLLSTNAVVWEALDGIVEVCPLDDKQLGLGPETGKTNESAKQAYL